MLAAHRNNFALVKVHFRSRKITATERIAVFGLTDFIGEYETKTNFGKLKTYLYILHPNSQIHLS